MYCGRKCYRAPGECNSTSSLYLINTILLYLIGTAQLMRLQWWVIKVKGSLGSKVVTMFVHAPFGSILFWNNYIYSHNKYLIIKPDNQSLFRNSETIQEVMSICVASQKVQPAPKNGLFCTLVLNNLFYDTNYQIIISNMIRL